MILSLHEQARLFLLCIALGGGMGLLYDCLRVFRHALRHRRFWVQAEDALFWLLAVFLVFGVLLRASSGEIRFFSVSGLFGGMGLYFLTLSRWVIAVSDSLIRLAKALACLFFQIMFTPFRLLSLPFRRPVRKFAGYCARQQKKLLQTARIYVKMNRKRFHRDWKILRRKARPSERTVLHGKKRR